MKKRNGIYIFDDAPEFTPNIAPYEIFKMGAFGGTYWRTIYSNVTNKQYRNQHLKYPKKWWRNIPEEHLIKPFDEYDKNINKYGVKVGSTLQEWEKKGWITKYNPYGWVDWYCGFFMGKRTEDDERQIKRWQRTAGPNSRFRRNLINQIINKNAKYNDYNISPKIRQTLLHWGYELKKKDLIKN